MPYTQIVNTVHKLEIAMFGTLKTLILGSNARAEERLRDTFAIELIDQKLREAEAGLRGAKATLASLIQRQRSEERLLDQLNGRISDMTLRAHQAMKQGREDLALPAAEAIAQMENEAALRQDTLARLEGKVIRLRQSVETAHRRIIDLHQGAIQARAIRKEQSLLRSLPAGQSNAFDEAEALIARVTGADDGFEHAEILQGLNRDLGHETTADRLADAGFGPATRVTAAEVMARLKPRP
jgi:phage shock protein A